MMSLVDSAVLTQNVPQTGTESPSFLPVLPENPQPADIEAFLIQFAQVVDQIECLATETDLSVLIHWALQHSYSSAFTFEQTMHLLDLTWTVQKLLWAIRSSQ